MDKLRSVWDNASTLGRVVIVGTAVVIVLFVIGAVAGDSEQDGGGDQQDVPEVVTTPEATTEATTAAETEPPAEPQQETSQKSEESGPSTEERARDALGDSVSSDFAVGESEVRSVDVNGQLVSITLSTPEGGFEGASTDDTDALASAALAKVYEDADWSGAGYVEFRGGLINTATGQEVPNEMTVNYRVERGPARQIDWSDKDTLFVIDWSIYRGFCHPAIKGC